MNKSGASSSFPTESSELIQAIRHGLNFHIPDEAWTDCTETDDKYWRWTKALPGSRLYSTFAINGIGFHCIAIEVRLSEENFFNAQDGVWEEELSTLYEAHGCSGALDTLTIRNRKYAVFAFPFGR